MRKILSLICLILLIVGLTGCKSDDYELAVTLQGAEAYEEALAIYTVLGEYEDSVSRAALCQDALDQIAAQAAAEAAYDDAAQALLRRNEILTAAIASAQAVRDSGAPLDQSLALVMDTTIANAKESLKAPVYAPREMDALAAATEEMNSVNYDTILSSLKEREQALSESISLFALVNNPSEEYIIACLKNVPGVTGIACVTEDNDPNGKLNKDGGYTATVYFGHENISKTVYDANRVIDIGTDGGGALEVYRTVEDAEARKTYLSSFDGTIFDSGSHTVLGTILIRTSYKMTATQQDELEAAILAALLPVDK